MTTASNKATDPAEDATPMRIYLNDWHFTEHRMAVSRRQALETKQWADCKFLVGQEPQQKIMEAHKLIMAMSSPVFKDMFFGEMAKEDEPIPITDVQPEVFEALLEYIYTDNMKFESHELVCDLWFCANKYKFPFLEEKCIEFVFLDLPPGKACRAYEITKLLDKPLLMKKCLKVIKANTETVLKEQTFEGIKLETVLMILEQEELNIKSEIELYSAVERWAKAECIRKDFDPENGDSMRSVLGNALTKIRFLTLTAQELADGIANSSLLNENEIVAIFSNISSRTPKYPAPEGFSTKRQKRYVEKNSLSDDQILQKAAAGKVSLQMMLVNGDKDDEESVERHCYRSVLGTRIIENASTKLCENFQVNKDIMLTGIQVPSQIRNDIFSYIEDLKIEILHRCGRYTVLASERFTAEVNTGTLVRIMFREPIKIEKDKDYIINIYFGKLGCYPKLSCQTDVDSDGTRFKFNEYYSASPRFISSIFYTLLD